MNRLLLLPLAMLFCLTHLAAQQPGPPPTATEIVHESQSPQPDKPSALSGNDTLRAPIVIPAGTSIEIESAYTVSSVDVQAGELISFRVLVPITIDGSVAIEEGALVTARVTLAKRGGHWGKAGRLSWTMVDVIAADGTRVVLAPETAVRNPDWSLLEKGSNKDKEAARGQGSIKGTSHKGEVATRTIIAAAIFPPLAPLALMHGFKRGENAVLHKGKRFVVMVKNESPVVPKHPTPAKVASQVDSERSH